MRLIISFNIGINLLIINLMFDNTREQLINLFNSMFCKESLRRNVYIFNSLNQQMQISIKTIAKERRVLQITSNIQTVILALKECPFIQILTHNSVKILMKGDEVIVKLSPNNSKKMNKKDVQELTKHMKCQFKEINQSFQIQFQSHAAIIQFIQRLKISNLNYHYQILQKNPYKCLEESISNMRKEKKNIKQKYEPQHQHQFTPTIVNYDFNHHYLQQLPVFIRKSVPSSDEQIEQSYKQKFVHSTKYVQKTNEPQVRLRFGSQDFPSFQSMSLNQKVKEKKV